MASAGVQDARSVYDLVVAGFQEVEASRWEDARVFFSDAIALKEELDAEALRQSRDLLALAYHGLARVEQTSGRFEEGLALLRQAREEASDVDPGIASLLESRAAMILIDMGVPDRADAPIARARTLSDKDAEDGDLNFGSRFDMFYALALQRMGVGRWQDVLDVLDEMAADIDWAEARKKMGEKRVRKNHASIAALRGTALSRMAQVDPEAFPRARVALTEVVDGADSHPLDRFTALTRLVQLHLDRFDLEAAKEALDRALRIRGEGGFGTLPQEEVAWLLALEARRERLAGDATEATHVRLREVLEQLLGRWRGVERLGGTGFLRFERARLLVTELLGHGDPEAALETLLRTQEIGVVWRSLGSPLVSLERVRKALCQQDSGCLVFFPGPDRSYLFAVDLEHVLRFELPKAPWIERKELEYRRWLLRDPRTLSERRREQRQHAIRSLGRELAEALFPEAARRAFEGWTHVRIAGRSLLNDAALETLPVFEGEALGLTHAVSDVPSLPVGVALAERRAQHLSGPERKNRALLLGAPELSPETRDRFPVLEDFLLTKERMRPFLDAMSAFEPVLLSGSEASTLAVNQAVARGANVLHVLAHGVSDSSLELRPMIALAPDESRTDGLLTVATARGLHAPDVVFLSVCRTADGVSRPGDAGAAHFGGAFLEAGASTVILSPQDVRMHAALAMTKAFYLALDGEGTSVSEALRRARVAMSATEQFRDPTSWGLVTAFGLGEAP